MLTNTLQFNWRLLLLKFTDEYVAVIFLTLRFICIVEL
jgi:hypothetical protein